MAGPLPTANPATLGERLLAERRRREMSLRAVAAQCGVSYSALSQVERGREPLFRTYERVQAWLVGAPDPRIRRLTVPLAFTCSCQVTQTGAEGGHKRWVAIAVAGEVVFEIPVHDLELSDAEAIGAGISRFADALRRALEREDA